MLQKEQLGNDIVNLRLQHRFAEIRLQNTQESLDKFMADYYSATTDLCQELAHLEDQIHDYELKFLGQYSLKFEPVDEKIIKVEPPKTRNQDLKGLYRRLMKTIHPDISDEKIAGAEYSRLVNEAYNSNNLRQLVKLDQLLSSRKLSEAELIRQKNLLIDSIFELKTQREQLKQSPAYKLRKKFINQEDGGKSMLAEIRGSLKQCTDEAKSRLMEMKITYLESMQRKILAA